MYIYLIVMKEIIARLKLASNTFFNRVSRLCAALLAVGTFLKASDHDIVIWGVSIATLGIGAGALGVLIAQLTVKSTEELKKELQDADNQTDN